MEDSNKDLIQSYVLTTAKYDFSVTEKRILYRLVELCQFATEGQKLNKDYAIQLGVFENMHKITLAHHLLLKHGESENYTEVKKALKSLRNKTIEYNSNGVWKVMGIIELPKFFEKGYVEFVVHPEIYQSILDFSKGFRKYELVTAMSFDSVFSMRFYELLSGQKKALTYTIDQLKIMFKVEDKYKLNADFIRYVVDKAKDELDEKSPYSFKYKKNMHGRKIVSITFYPVYIAKNRDPNLEKRELQKKASLSWDLDRIVVNYLKENFGFTDKEIKNNLDLLKVASKELDDLMFLLSELRGPSKTKKNPKGWTIGAIKTALDKKTK